jgi:hypothetical protein
MNRVWMLVAAMAVAGAKGAVALLLRCHPRPFGVGFMAWHVHKDG